EARAADDQRIAAAHGQQEFLQQLRAGRELELQQPRQAAPIERRSEERRRREEVVEARRRAGIERDEETAVRARVARQQREPVAGLAAIAPKIDSRRAVRPAVVGNAARSERANRKSTRLNS